MATQAKKITSTHDRGQIGRQGEQLAADFLAAQGCRILERNWRCRFGEIDIIALRAGRIHFVEVKTRTGRAFGYPEESVTAAKRVRWFRAIECWLRQSGAVYTEYQADVISILVKGMNPEIQWIQQIEE